MLSKWAISKRARAFIYFLMNLGPPWSKYDEFIVRCLWKKKNYYYIFENAVIHQARLASKFVRYHSANNLSTEITIDEYSIFFLMIKIA